MMRLESSVLTALPLEVRAGTHVTENTDNQANETTLRFRVQKFIVAVRTDDRVQVWSDRHAIPENVPWRPVSLITLLGDPNVFPEPAAAPAPTTATGSTQLALPVPSDTTWKVYVKNLRKGADAGRIGADFDGDTVEMVGPTSCTVTVGTASAYEKALGWHRTYYRGMLISVVKSTR